MAWSKSGNSRMPLSMPSRFTDDKMCVGGGALGGLHRTMMLVSESKRHCRGLLWSRRGDFPALPTMWSLVSVQFSQNILTKASPAKHASPSLSTLALFPASHDGRLQRPSSALLFFEALSGACYILAYMPSVLFEVHAVDISRSLFRGRHRI